MIVCSVVRQNMAHFGVRQQVGYEQAVFPFTMILVSRVSSLPLSKESALARELAKYAETGTNGERRSTNNS